MTARIALLADGGTIGRDLRRLLDSIYGLRVAGVAVSADELLDRVADWRPQIVILNACRATGFAAARRLREAAPAVRVVAMGQSIVPRAGITGWIRGNAPVEAWLAVILAGLS